MNNITSTNKKDILLILCLSCIIFSVYSVSIYYPFLESFDDNTYILNNSHLSFTFTNIKYWFKNACAGCYLPVTMLSMMLDNLYWGLNSFGYHFQNIFWHIIAVVAIYKCFRVFGIHPVVSFFISLIFAVHPQRVESVVWISERKDVLCAAFYFLSTYFYIKKAGNSFPILSFIFFILAILSKPMAVSLPIVLLIYEWYKIVVSGQWSVVNKKIIKHEKVESGEWRVVGTNLSTTGKEQEAEESCKSRTTTQQLNKSANQQINIISLIRKIRDLYKLIPYFIILFIFIPVSIITQSNAGAIQQSSAIFSYQRFFSVVYNIYWYFNQTFLCTENSPIFHPHIVNFYSISKLIIFYVSTFIILTYVYLKDKKLFFLAVLPLILAYIFALLPVSGLVKLGPTDHADRYSYIPAFFIWLSVGLILAKITIDRKIVYIILLLYSIVSILLNIQYQRFWQNNYTLFTYAKTYYNVNAHILISLADMEMDMGKYNEALKTVNDLNNDKNWKPIADFYKVAILYKIDKTKSYKPLLKLKTVFEKNLNRKIFRVKYRIIIQMLKSIEMQNKKE